VWRICRDNGWWSVFGRPCSRRKTKAGTPAHDDLVRRDFTADAPNRLWLADINEHPTSEGNLYLAHSSLPSAAMNPRVRAAGSTGQVDCREG
jgi:transposase InsO family protein